MLLWLSRYIKSPLGFKKLWFILWVGVVSVWGIVSNCVVKVAFNTYSLKIHIMWCEYIYIYIYIYIYLKKSKVIPLQARCGPEVLEVQLYSSMTAALEGGEWSAARFGRTLPPGPILQEAGWVPGPVWTGGKSRPHRHSIPDRPARSQSPYRLS